MFKVWKRCCLSDKSWIFPSQSASFAREQERHDLQNCKTPDLTSAAGSTLGINSFSSIFPSYCGLLLELIELHPQQNIICRIFDFFDHFGSPSLTTTFPVFGSHLGIVWNSTSISSVLPYFDLIFVISDISKKCFFFFKKTCQARNKCTILLKDTQV